MLPLSTDPFPSDIKPDSFKDGETAWQEFRKERNSRAETKLGGIKFPKKSRRAAPPKNSPDKDLVYTPRDLARKIVSHFRPYGYIIEPCRGTGAFYDHLTAYSYEPVDWCELSEGRDFLNWNFRDKRYNWLITNFPFSKYVPFLEKSMQIADNIVTFGTINHILALRKRLRMVKEAGFYIREVLLTDTPKGWSSGGFQCGAILLTKQAGDCKFSYLT